MQHLSDYWSLAELKSGHKLSVFGPNGYLSEFSNEPAGNSAAPEVKVRYDSLTGDIHLTLHNPGASPRTLEVRNSYDAASVRNHTIAPNKTVEEHCATGSSAGWFDISVTQESAPGFLRRFAGHVETGKPSTSDPAVFKEA